MWVRNKINSIDKNILLEDTVVKIEREIDYKEPWDMILPANINRLLLVEDEIYTYLVETATEIQTQIKIDSNSGTTKTGSLRYQELLPADSFLYTLMYFKDKYVPDYPKKNEEKEKNEEDEKALEELYNQVKNLQMEAIIKSVETTINGFIQIGGDYTLGRGLCAIKWITLSK
jgi:CRISPR-associated protein Cmr4